MNKLNIEGDMWVVMTQAGFRKAAKITATEMDISWRLIDGYPTKYPAVVSFSKGYVGYDYLHVEIVSVDTLLHKLYCANVTIKSHEDILTIRAREALLNKKAEELKEPNYLLHIFPEDEDGNVVKNAKPDKMLLQPVECKFESGGLQLEFSYDRPTVGHYLNKLLTGDINYKTIVCAEYSQHNHILLSVHEMKNSYLMNFTERMGLITAEYMQSSVISKLDITDPNIISKLKGVYKLKLHWNPNRKRRK